MKITLVGYMGAGKSTVGKILSEKLGLPLRDLDLEIQKETGHSITETIFNKGELYFRKLERAKLGELLGQEKFILSTGGGTPCYYDNIDLINQHSLSIYIRYSVPELYKRLEYRQAHRPLIAHLEGEALKEFIGKHLFERAAFYEKSTLVVHGKEKSPTEIANEIKTLIHE